MRDVFGDVEVDGVFGVFSVQGVDDGEDVISGGHAARFAVDGTVEGDFGHFRWAMVSPTFRESGSGRLRCIKSPCHG